MKVTDYIISYLKQIGVTDIFGYPGGAINHLIDSAAKTPGINAHVTYHEQGAAFAACGYAQASNKLGVAYSTCGPGATNLITGIANAYFDSIPTLFITGQVDSNTRRGALPIRQRGFQETDVVPMVAGISKWAVSITNAEQIKYCLEKACYIAFEGDPGPVVLDIPNDIQRADIPVDGLPGFERPSIDNSNDAGYAGQLLKLVKAAHRPVFLFGNGIKQAGAIGLVEELMERVHIPAVFSLPAADILPYAHPLNFGFIGTNGRRYANWIVEKCDLVVAFGCRLSVRQIGLERQNFAPLAQLVRVDIDPDQLSCPVKDNEVNINADVRGILAELVRLSADAAYLPSAEWLSVCAEIKQMLLDADDEPYNNVITAISEASPENIHVAGDVGQNLLWTVRSFHTKHGQRMFLSTGHGAMGYSIPAAIGIFYASHRMVYAFCGDGGFMMNLQELQFVKREKLPIKIFCLNNHALGMIRAWQGRYLERYAQTTEQSGYQAVDLKRAAKAFELKYTCIESLADISALTLNEKGPELIEIRLSENTETKPFGPMRQQSPALDETILERLTKL